MYDSVLVPLDGSKRAEAILPHVQKVVRPGSSKVTLMTALEPKAVASSINVQSQHAITHTDEQIKMSEVYLENLVDDLIRRDIQAEPKVVIGPPVEMIIKVAEEINADLIAIASHGRSGLGRVFYGSIAAGVLAAVDRPLLLIRSRSI